MIKGLMNYDLKRFLFRSSHFSFFDFWSLMAKIYENTKILRNLCLHFARQDGQDGKKRKENHATKVTKIPKTKRLKYGMNETDLPVDSTFTYIYT